jgi:hypothetical protein
MWVLFDRDQPWSTSVWIKPSEIAACQHPCRGKGADDSAAMVDPMPSMVSLLSQGHFWPGGTRCVQAKQAVGVDEWTHLRQLRWV